MGDDNQAAVTKFGPFSRHHRKLVTKMAPFAVGSLSVIGCPRVKTFVITGGRIRMILIGRCGGKMRSLVACRQESI